jgi:paxillin
MLLHRQKEKEPLNMTKPGTMNTTNEHGQLPLTSRFGLRVPTRTPEPVQAKESQKQWTADFLKDLRTNRPVRPGGARPLPGKAEKDLRNSTVLPERATSAMGMRGTLADVKDMPERSASALSNRRTTSTMGPREQPGRPVARFQSGMRNVSNSTAQTTETETTIQTQNGTLKSLSKGGSYRIPYYERGQRWMERQEMSSLRRALEDKDSEQEKKIHIAAQDEASELVWKHQNPDAPFPNPDRDYRSHLVKGSHARSLSNGPYENLYVRKGPTDGSRSASDGSDTKRTVSGSSQESNDSKRFSSLSFSMRSKKLFNKRASVRSRDVGNELGAIFKNPADQIYEAPDEVIETRQDEKPAPLKPKPRNTSYGNKSIKDKIARIEEVESPPKKVSIVEIHKNPPSQSRNAHYQTNQTPPVTPDTPEVEPPKSRDGKEIRSDDIVAATSMRLKDRSPKLPTPTVVSDKPGRPIVSFEKNWKPREKELQQIPSRSSLDSRREKPTQDTSIPSINITPTVQGDDEIPTIVVETAVTPSIPTISIAEEPAIAPPVPTISIGEESSSVPSISVSSSVPVINAPTTPSRPLPQPTKRPSPSRPLPQPGSVIRSAPHWSPAPGRSTAQCAACALPIAGKIVSASSQRFHPHCFSCCQCGELLECVAFYPEPDKSRDERLARIQARLDGTAIPSEQAHFTEEDDGDDGLRFYCHLDFHEKFSPRCKSCKTPIEGQVILACGSEWHVGHFFCAECGDPFDSSTPFVEKDGWAWCVGCHTKRYSGKCAGCRKPITDMVVSALGKEWHNDCFKCKVS